jgi:hypothetical protein
MAVYKNVGWLDITVNNARAVCRLERAADLNSPCKYGREWEWPRSDDFFESLALEKFHHDIVGAFLTTDVKEHADVWMI